MYEIVFSDEGVFPDFVKEFLLLDRARAVFYEEDQSLEGRSNSAAMALPCSCESPHGLTRESLPSFPMMAGSNLASGTTSVCRTRIATGSATFPARSTSAGKSGELPFSEDLSK